MEKNAENVNLIKSLINEKMNALQPGDPMMVRLAQLMGHVDHFIEDGISVDTPMGTLLACRSGDANYPGITVVLRRNGNTDAPLAITEYTETEGEAPEGPHIISRIWKDVRFVEYTDRLIHEKFDEFFNGEYE